MNETKQTELKVRPRRLEIRQETEKKQEKVPELEWIETPKKRWQDRLLPNLAVASALMLCAVALRTGAVPSLTESVQAVMTAATNDSLLNEELGKLTFVSAIFPEAALVFGETAATLTMPVTADEVVHAWSEQEPFISWDTKAEEVMAAASGEVIGVYHGDGEERLVQVLGEDGLSCLYGNLAQVYVQTGDAVQSGDVVGTLLTGKPCVFEVRQDGRSVDPSVMMKP